MIKVLVIEGIRDDRYIRVGYYKPGKVRFTLDGVSEALNDVLKNDLFEIHTLLLPFIVEKKEEIESLAIKYDEFNIIYNSICEPDICRNALIALLQLLKYNKNVPIINHPSKVLEISRDMVYQKLKDIKGLYVPKVVRIKPTSLNSIKEVADGENFYPFIFREAGKHTNSEAVLIRSPKEIDLLEPYPFMGKNYYMVEFVNYASEDGLYRKYRVVSIDGNFYPRHMIVSDHWNVHGKDRKRLMDKDARYRTEEKDWLKNFSIRNYPQLKEIHKKIGLDIYIIDFSILKDGKMVIFEVSPCFTYGKTLTDNKELYDYYLPYIDVIDKAVISLFKRKAFK